MFTQRSAKYSTAVLQTSRKPARQDSFNFYSFTKTVVQNPTQQTTCSSEFGSGSCKISHIFRAFLLEKSCIVLNFYYLIYYSRYLQLSWIKGLTLGGVSLSFCYCLQTSMCRLLQTSSPKSGWFVLSSWRFLQCC